MLHFWVSLTSYCGGYFGWPYGTKDVSMEVCFAGQEAYVLVMFGVHVEAFG